MKTADSRQVQSNTRKAAAHIARSRFSPPGGAGFVDNRAVAQRQRTWQALADQSVAGKDLANSVVVPTQLKGAEGISSPIIQRFLSENDLKTKNAFKKYILSGKWIDGLNYLRAQYGIGDESEYDFDIDNLESSDRKAHDYAVTHRKGDGLKGRTIISVDTSKVLELMTGSKEGGFEALISTLRHEYEHVLQFNKVISGKAPKEVLTDEDISEFLAYSEELLQNNTGGKKGKLKRAPYTVGEELNLAYTRALEHYNKMGTKDQKTYLNRKERLVEMYAFILGNNITDYGMVMIEADEKNDKAFTKERRSIVREIILSSYKCLPEKEKAGYDKFMTNVKKANNSLAEKERNTL